MYPFRTNRITMASMCIMLVILCGILDNLDYATGDHTADGTRNTSDTTTVAETLNTTAPTTAASKPNTTNENYLWKDVWHAKFWYSPLLAISIAVAIVFAFYMCAYYLT